MNDAADAGWRNDSEVLAEAARRLGLPSPLGHFYLPLLRPADISAKGIDQRTIADPARLFSRPAIERFAARIAPHQRATLPAHATIAAHGLGLGYEPVATHIYYQTVCAFAPDLIVEVGAGVSTWYAREALWGSSGRIICIEPFPRPEFVAWCASNQVELWREPLQDCAGRIEFGARPLLFVDSTHVASITSDVNEVFLNLLHRMPSGSLIHFDDIFLPFPCLHAGHNSFAHTVNWYESVLLGIFLLAARGQYETVFPQYWMGRDDGLRPILEAAVPFYQRTHWEGASYWISKT
jgi:hypothetical protein